MNERKKRIITQALNSQIIKFLESKSKSMDISYMKIMDERIKEIEEIRSELEEIL